jgi:sarcosine oxidase subunit alpha
MPETVVILVNGVRRQVSASDLLAPALLNLGLRRFRESVSGEPRAPLCGIGVCQECRVTVDGLPGVRACMTPVREGMKVETA